MGRDERTERATRSVLVVGVGGLGCPAALVLASAGIGRLGLADGDRVELSNLHRQILQGEAGLGRNKAAVAAERLRAIAPTGVALEVHETDVTPANAARLLARYDFVIDATDRPGTKFLLNDAAVLLGKPLSHAGVVGLEGQLLTVLPRRTACLRCLFPAPPTDGESPSCREAGILGPVAGMIGAFQASEALRVLSGAGAVFADRLLTFDAHRFRFRTIPLRRSLECPLCGTTPHIDRIPACEEII